MVFTKPGFTAKKQGKAKGAFKGEIRKLMYGSGDHETPNEASVDLLEAYIDEFMINLIT